MCYRWRLMNLVDLTHESQIVASKHQVSCDLEGEVAILNLDNGVYYGLDSVGAQMWKQIQEPTTLAQILAKLLRYYDVSSETLEFDIRRLLSELAAHGLVKIGT